MEKYNKEFLNYLNGLCKDNQNRTVILDKELLEKSKKIIESSDFNTYDEAFVYFAALNYLNAYVKKDRKNLSYSFKNKVQPGIYAILTNKLNKIRFYYEKKERVCYISFYDFIFSFHYVDLNLEMYDYLSNERRIEFDGIRKQCTADLILGITLKDFSNNYNLDNNQASIRTVENQIGFINGTLDK